MKKGIYATWYGNAAYVAGPKARTAYDLDMGGRIPIEEVDASKFIRNSDKGEMSHRLN